MTKTSWCKEWGKETEIFAWTEQRCNHSIVHGEDRVPDMGKMDMGGWDEGHGVPDMGRMDMGGQDKGHGVTLAALRFFLLARACREGLLLM